jgi:hypothetical protein
MPPPPFCPALLELDPPEFVAPEAPLALDAVPPVPSEPPAVDELPALFVALPEALAESPLSLELPQPARKHEPSTQPAANTTERNCSFAR